MEDRLLFIGASSTFEKDLAAHLEGVGFDCRSVRDAASGLRLSEEFEPSVLLCEAELPGGSGLDVLEEHGRAHPFTPVLVLVSAERVDDVIRAFRKGAFDVLAVPAPPDEVASRCRLALHPSGATIQTRYVRRRLSAPTPRHGMVGGSRDMVRVFELMDGLSASRSNVLILGESGTGKELVARAIHAASPARDGPFVVVDCAALSPDLLESELFGHSKGSFTGATTDRPGYFEAARGGTLLLDEVSELPLELQPKLLRAIQEREVARIGRTTPVPTDVRLLATSSVDLRQECEGQRFREDLYYRLRVVEIHVPALRERREDIPLLVEDVAVRFARELGRPFAGVDPSTMRMLTRYDWPGNVRELENVVERALIVALGAWLQTRDFSEENLRAAPVPGETRDLRAALRAFEADHIRRVLQATRGSREQAAKRLRVDPSTLFRKMAMLGMGHDKGHPTRRDQ